MPRRKKKPGLLRHGYWDYADPAPAIRKLLEGHEELLGEFQTMLDEDSTHADFRRWAAGKGVPARVRTLVAKAKPSGQAELFDEVEVAGGSGPDMGGMCDSGCTLTARRVDGVIRYRVSEDGVEPEDSTEPLDQDAVLECVLGDTSYFLDESAVEEVLEAHLEGERTPESVEQAIAGWANSASVWSEFYDLEGHWAGVVEAVREIARGMPAEAAEAEE